MHDQDPNPIPEVRVVSFLFSHLILCLISSTFYFWGFHGWLNLSCHYLFQYPFSHMLEVLLLASQTQDMLGLYVYLLAISVIYLVLVFSHHKDSWLYPEIATKCLDWIFCNVAPMTYIIRGFVHLEHGAALTFRHAPSCLTPSPGTKPFLIGWLSYFSLLLFSSCPWTFRFWLVQKQTWQNSIREAELTICTGLWEHWK